MIEVNLLPGGRKRQAGGKGIKLGLPRRKGDKASAAASGRSFDPWIMGSAAAVALSLGLMGWMFMGAGSRTTELTLEIEEAARDSARYADLIQQTEGLRARRDTISQKVGIIQDIDGNRYVWPHVMDEVARALPDYTWLTSIVQIEGGSAPTFRVDGRAGNNFALTRFMDNLEASPFIRNVRLITTERQAVNLGGNAGQREVHQFTLQASFDQPPPELIETVPLFSANLGGTLVP
ncbi:MAG: PilN domain-containing protein [Gemmatimonadota bacterium]